MTNLKKFALLIFLVITQLAIIGQPKIVKSGPGRNKINEKLITRIKAFNQEYKRSLQHKNFDQLSNFYSVNAMLMPEYQSAVTSRYAVTRYFGLLTKRFNIQSFEKATTEIISMDTRVIEIGNFKTTFNLIEKDSAFTLSGNYLNIWETEANTDPKILVEAWNYNHDIKNRQLFTFSELGRSSWNDSFLTIANTSIAFELAGLNELMVKCVSEHNAQLWLQFFTKDAKYIYSHTPAKEGYHEIREHLVEHCKHLPKFEKLLIGNNRIDVLDGFVIEYASHYVEWSFGERKGISTGKDIRIWKRMPDCSLKIYRQIAMYDN